MTRGAPFATKDLSYVSYPKPERFPAIIPVMSKPWQEKWRNQWSLITGATAGIGLELAKLLAANGSNLVLTARRTDRLRQIATDLSSTHQIRVETVAADLTQPNAATQILDFTRSKTIEVEFLINNAGFGAFGYAHEIPAEKMLEMIQVNCSAVVHLTRLYTPAMVQRGHGDVLILASLASFQPVPFNSVYAATKAFDLLFAEGIAEELRPRGVQVCALCPGSTNTEFQKVADQPDRVFRSAETAEKVARVGLEAMAAGKSYVISGFMNNVMKESQRLAPRSLVTKMAANMMRPDKS
jgi:short-subunit dehydrogenase